MIRMSWVGLAGDGNRSAGFGDDGFGDGQAESGTAGGAGAGWVAAVEAIEDVGQGFGGDSVAMVLDKHDGCQSGRSGFEGELDFDGGGSGTVLESVQEQVGEEQVAIFGG